MKTKMVINTNPDLFSEQINQAIDALQKQGGMDFQVYYHPVKSSEYVLYTALITYK